MKDYEIYAAFARFGWFGLLPESQRADTVQLVQSLLSRPAPAPTPVTIERKALTAALPYLAHADVPFDVYAAARAAVDSATQAPAVKPERCPCGYPMPCSKTAPVGFCRSHTSVQGSQP